MPRHLLLAAAVALGASAAQAEGFRTISDESTFLTVLQGKQLTRLGIKLDVSPSGRIAGRAFGKQVTGAWRWSNGFFCRDLTYGADPLEPNCQLVKVRGDTLRFIADRGAGMSADLRLR